MNEFEVIDATPKDAAKQLAPLPEPSTVREKREQFMLQVWELRKRGLKLEDIAIALGKSSKTVSKYLRSAEDKFGKATSRVDRNGALALELSRLDDLLVALYPALQRGDPHAVAAALKITERRARMLGLDTPVQVETRSETVAKVDDEQMRRIAEAYLNGRQIK